MIIEDISKLFGATESTEHLDGGRGTSYKAGDIVIKHVFNPTKADEVADIVSRSRPSSALRIQQPIKSIDGNWVENDHVAWSYEDGFHDHENRFEEKMKLCDDFADMFSEFGSPKFLDHQNTIWSRASDVAWGNKDYVYSPEFERYIAVVKNSLKPISLRYCIVHEDLTGNIIFSNDGKPPLAIDITLAWKPRDYAKAVIVADAIAYNEGDESVYDLVKDLPDIDQLILRATLKRIVAKAEKVVYMGADIDRARREVTCYLDMLGRLKLVP